MTVCANGVLCGVDVEIQMCINYQKGAIQKGANGRTLESKPSVLFDGDGTSRNSLGVPTVYTSNTNQHL